MQYQEHRPSPELRRSIECFWTLRGSPAESPAPQPILPDGCVEVVLNFGDCFERHFEDRSWELQPRRFVVGQMLAPVVTRPQGSIDVLGIRLRLAGAGSFLGMPVAAITQSIVSLDAISPSLDRDCADRIASQRSLAARLRAVEDSLLRVLARSSGADSMAERAADLATRAHGVVSVSGLLRLLSVDRRQLERKFQNSVGLSPKLFCRILRFQHVFTALQTREDWAAVAMDCGYYDQAHLIRDFKQFAAQPPSQFFSSNHHLALSLSRRDRLSHSSNTFD